MRYMRKNKHDTMYDYTYALSNNFDKLPLRWIDYFVLRLSNKISDAMHWKNVYHCTYIRNPDRLVITGFPPYELRRDLNNFDSVFIRDIEQEHHNHGKAWTKSDINLPQIDYVVHKLHYKQAVVYLYGKNINKIIFYKETHDEEKPCAYIEFIQEDSDLSSEDEDPNCNILTPDNTEEEEHHCECCNNNNGECPHG